MITEKATKPIKQRPLRSKRDPYKMPNSIMLYRVKNRISTYCLAERAGIPYAHRIAEWETGKSEITLSNAKKLAIVLGVSADKLGEPPK